MTTGPEGKEGQAFAVYLDGWRDGLGTLPLADLVAEAGGAAHVGVFCVDLTNGFCYEGALQSDRVRAIVPAIADLMVRSHDLGVRRYVLPQDAHPADSVEFTDYPPHCLAGTAESETVSDLTRLPFAHLLEVMPKNSIDSSIGTGLDAWVAAHPEVTHRVVVGDCTDLCVYQLAMHLKLLANARNERRPVVVPADCVDTYGVPVETARHAGIAAHPAALLHALFLYHMALNGIRVVRALT